MSPNVPVIYFSIIAAIIAVALTVFNSTVCRIDAREKTIPPSVVLTHAKKQFPERFKSCWIDTTQRPNTIRCNED